MIQASGEIRQLKNVLELCKDCSPSCFDATGKHYVLKKGANGVFWDHFYEMREVKVIKRLLRHGNMLFSMKYSLQAHEKKINKEIIPGITDGVHSLGNFRPGRRKQC